MFNGEAATINNKGQSGNLHKGRASTGKLLTKCRNDILFYNIIENDSLIWKHFKSKSSVSTIVQVSRYGK